MTPHVDIGEERPGLPDNPPDQLGFWRSTGAFVSEGLERRKLTPQRVAQIADGRGLDWVAVQDGPNTRQQRQAIEDAFSDHDIALVVWATRLDESATDAISQIAYWRPAGKVVNVEGPGPWDTYCDMVRDAYPLMPLGVITNFAGAGAMPDGSYSRAASKPFIDNRFACIPECYVVNEQGEQPNNAPDHAEFTAVNQLGYPTIFPCFGIYRCPPARYDEYLPAYPHHSWYLLENFPEAQ